MNAPISTSGSHTYAGRFPAAAGWVDGRGVNARASDGTPCVGDDLDVGVLDPCVRDHDVDVGRAASEDLRKCEQRGSTSQTLNASTRSPSDRRRWPGTLEAIGVDVIDALDDHPTRERAERTSVSTVATILRAGASPTWASAPSTNELPNENRRPASTVRATKLRDARLVSRVAGLAGRGTSAVRREGAR